jgi:hypothetical protein
MPLFMCRECGCVENTACANYWDRRYSDKPLLCSACDPSIGEWHGRFPQRPAAGMLVDQDGHLWCTDEGVPSHYKILGSVVQPANREKA